MKIDLQFTRMMKKMRKESGSDEFVRVVSDECEQQIGRLFVETLAKAVTESPLEDTHPKIARSLYIKWRDYDLEGLSRYVQARLEANPCEVHKFLTAIAGIHMHDSGEYPFITSIISAEQLRDFIGRCYPKTDDDLHFSASRRFIQMSENANSTASSSENS